MDHDDLVKELRTLRERGLLRIRHTPLPLLTAVSARLGLPTGADVLPSSITRLLDRVVAGLDGTLATATAYTLGVAPGTRDWPAQDRRRRAAQEYGVSVERFRKHHELLILENVAQEILALETSPDTADRPPETRTRWIVPVRGDGRAREVPLGLIRCPVETVRDVDVVVSSENVYLEMSRTFRSSFSASLRNAAARRGPVGELVDDVLQRELRTWMRAHGREGLPVTPGTVVPTSSGELAAQGVRRIYHAAVVVPRPHADDYVVEPAGVVRAVHQVFGLARTEREAFEPPLRSLCLPLFGAGRGGLEAGTSFSYLWTALCRELLDAEQWDVHLITRRASVAGAVAAALTGLGGRRA